RDDHLLRLNWFRNAEGGSESIGLYKLSPKWKRGLYTGLYIDYEVGAYRSRGILCLPGWRIWATALWYLCTFFRVVLWCRRILFRIHFQRLCICFIRQKGPAVILEK